mgnify:CR=1 FL=1
MHDPGDECDCSECRVRAIWPAEQITREDRSDRISSQSTPQHTEAAAILEAIAAVLNGHPVSDFMGSFAIVRDVEDLVHRAYLCTCDERREAEYRKAATKKANP